MWDIAGKAANLPVYRLLGGKVRDQVRTYRTLYHHEMGVGHTPDGYRKWAEYGLGAGRRFHHVQAADRVPLLDGARTSPTSTTATCSTTRPSPIRTRA